MTRAQTRILAAGIVVAAAMLVCPPFHVRVTDSLVWKMGYAFLWDPPRRGFVEATVNYELLGLQWLGVAAVTAVLLARRTALTPGRAPR
ncbi:MAG: hypothetical protein MZV65_21370 [Chromatiales bacterium]|nr:hypothetical protein [Chromatiales bacterium]